MKTTKRLLKRKTEGMILPFAIVLLVVLLTIGGGLLGLGYQARIRVIRTTAEMYARAAADAGITQAVRLMEHKLANELIWNNNTLPSETNILLPGSDSGYDFKIMGDPNKGWLLTSQGRSGIADKTVYCMLGVKSSWFGIGVKEGVDFKFGTKFGTIPAGGKFKIQTNSTEKGAVILKSGITIPGDIIVGPGGDPDEVINPKDSTVIEGDMYAAEMSMEFPSVVVPPSLATLPATVYAYNPGVPLTGDIKFDILTIPNSSLQEVTGNCRIYVASDMTLGQGAEFAIKAGSSLALYLNGNLESRNSTGITNETKDATKLTLYGTDNCTKINLKAKSDFYGAIYAPNAALNIYNGGDLYGAFVGNETLSIKNSGSFYFATALLKTFVNSEVAYIAVERWWEE